MWPCTVVLRHQLPAALRLGKRWAELCPPTGAAPLAPLTVLVADGDASDCSSADDIRVLDPAGAGLLPAQSMLLRLLHLAADAHLVYGPWVLQAALQHATPTDTAVLIDARTDLDATVVHDILAAAALVSHAPLAFSATPGFVVASPAGLSSWMRVSMNGLSADDLRRHMISVEGALVVPASVALTVPGLVPHHERAWACQRDGEPLPPQLRALTIGWVAAHVDRTHPQLAPVAGGAGDRFELLARDLLCGTPRDLRSGSTERHPASVPAAPPDPFGADPQAYRSWLMAPVTPGPFAVSRAIADVHRHRPDLHETYCDLGEPTARRGLLHWCATFGREEGVLPTCLIPGDPGPDTAQPSLSVSPPTASPGLLVAGYLDAALGLGEAARLMVAAAERAGERVATYTYRHLICPGVDWHERGLSGPAADVHLLCLNGAALPRFMRSVGPRFNHGRYVVALWFWETERLTASMREGFAHVDEVWTSSEYSAQAIRTDAPAHCPVLVMPVGVNVPAARVDAPVARMQLGLPPGWLVGFSFDHGSMRERKNPVGLIEAYRSAFPVPELGVNAPHLVVKTMNAPSHPASGAAVAEAAAGREDITVIDGTWTPAQQHLFVAALDCYASLHRAEGYGLLLLEAMAMGVPVVATGATGNLAFMNEQNSWLVPTQRITMDRAFGPYDAGSVVHEPDASAAAELLRSIYDDRDSEQVRGRVARAVEDTRALADGSAAAAWIQQRLAAIRAARHG